MRNPALAALSYQEQDRQVSWCGVSMIEGQDFDNFITNDVASRLYDEEGNNAFEAHLRGLAGTGFARENLNSILAAEIQEERDWAIGEALAETYLSQEHEITWPWNSERDKRHPKASLPGADLVGFVARGGDVRLVLGEVKTSTEENTPPGVMTGRSGMTHQIDSLANELSLIYQLLKWLWFRCKNTVYEVSFNAAIGLYFSSGNKDVALFGVLIRDTQPNELDLQARGRTLATTLRAPTTCQLTAIYLPCAITEFPARVSRGRS